MILAKNSFSATNEMLPDILAWIEEQTVEFLPVALALNLQLAAEEAVVNVINYAYPEDAAHRPLLLTFGQDEAFYLEIADNGRPFNPLEGIETDPTAPLEEREPGGWGRELILRVTTHAHYEYRDNTNVLRLEEDPHKTI